MLSTVGLGHFMLFKFHFLLVLQPTVDKLMQHFYVCLKPICCVVYSTAGHFCSSLSSALWDAGCIAAVASP